MSRPRKTTLTRRARGGTADPGLLRHPEERPETGRDLDLAIARAVRSALYPDTPVPARLNARVMARVRARAAKLLRRPGPADLLITGVLAGAGAYAAFVATGGGGFFAPNPYSVVFGVIGGAIVAWYHRWRSDRERARADRAVRVKPAGMGSAPDFPGK